jgi:hypothetical protein
VLGTNFGSKPVAAQVTTRDVIIFHCSVVANQPDYFALGFSHYPTRLGIVNKNPTMLLE